MAGDPKHQIALCQEAEHPPRAMDARLEIHLRTWCLRLRRALRQRTKCRLSRPSYQSLRTLDRFHESIPVLINDNEGLEQALTIWRLKQWGFRRLL